MDGKTADAKKSYAQMKEQEEVLKMLKNQNGAGSLAMFGTKAPDLVQKINQGMRKKIFKGNIYGPIGSFLQIKAGKEKWAKLTETCIGDMTLCSFICDNNADIQHLRRMRKETNCRSTELPLHFQRPGPRYNINVQRVEGVEICIDVLNIENDLVHNFLCDSSR